MKSSHLPDAKSKTLVIRFSMNLGLSENLNKDIENINIKIQDIKKNQSDRENIKTEIKKIC